MGKTIIGNRAMVNIMSWPSECYLKKRKKKKLNPVFIHMYACSHTRAHFCSKRLFSRTASSPKKTVAVMGKELHYSNFYSTQIMWSFAETYKN